MKLDIKDIGPINEAKIELGKITVIAGPNASGKTTSSKLLYCFLASVSSDGEYLADKGLKERLRPLLVEISQIIKDKYEEESYKLRDLSFELDLPLRFATKTSVQEIYDESISIFDKIEFENKASFKKRFNKFKELIEVKTGDNVINPIINTLLNIEFDINKQSHVIFNKDSSIQFRGEFNDCKFINTLSLDETGGTGTISNNYLDCFKVDEVSYLESPYVLDLIGEDDLEWPNSNVNYHQRLLISKLKDTSSEEDVFDGIEYKNIIKFQNNINKIIGGQFKFDKKDSSFLYEKNDLSFTLKNISAGLKQLGIIYLLLGNRKLPEDSFLIMDEPEVHLHPEWQIKLADLIVLLAKELNITVYINSHSPQFIEAIAVYSEYRNIKKDIHYYLTEELGSSGKFNFKKINNNELEIIYKNLGNPYKDLDKIIGKTLAKQFKGRD